MREWKKLNILYADWIRIWASFALSLPSLPTCVNLPTPPPTHTHTHTHTPYVKSNNKQKLIYMAPRHKWLNFLGQDCWKLARQQQVQQEEDFVYLVSILVYSVFAGLHGIKHIGMIIFILETHFRSSSKTNTVALDFEPRAVYDYFKRKVKIFEWTIWIINKQKQLNNPAK